MDIFVAEMQGNFGKASIVMLDRNVIEGRCVNKLAGDATIPIDVVKPAWRFGCNRFR